ncbi:MAG: WYL domain-containing transcriptional regulator [Deltaproteobacteria bacterium]|nr:WYL domain-containing transcriptional regulator [Deltaproteobacteria bacterium]
MGKPTWARMERLLDALQNQHYGKSVAELVEVCGITTRSVQRYLRALREEDVLEPAGLDASRRQRWRLTEFGKKPIRIAYSISELFTQRLALQSVAPLVAGTELEAALRSLAVKIEAALPEPFKEMARGVAAALPVRPVPRMAKRPGELVIEDVLEAAVRRWILQVEYRAVHGGGKTKCYRLKPLAVFPHKGALYVAAIAGDHTKPVNFALERFVSVEPTKETFDPPAGFDASEFVRRSFGVFDGAVEEVRVRFSAQVAPVVRERIWHESQAISDLPDGRIDITFRAAGWPEIRAWVLSYGEHAELIEPAARRKETEKELAAMVRRYA